MDGYSLDSLLTEDPGFCFTNLLKIKAFQSLLQSRTVGDHSKLPLMCYNQESESAQPVKDWYELNLFEENRKFKQTQLWLWGPPSVGKTTFVRHLDRLCRLVLAPTSEDYWCHYTDECDLVVFDEFKGQKTISFMNSFVQGWKCPLKRKTIGSYMKQKNVPVIVLSNHSIQDCYRAAVELNPRAVESLEARFLEVYWPLYCDLRPILDYHTTI